MALRDAMGRSASVRSGVGLGIGIGIGIGGTLAMLAVSMSSLLVAGPSPEIAAAADGEARVHYIRFERRLAPSAIELELSGDASSRGDVQVSISNDYAQAIDVRRILPRPERTMVGRDGLLLMFRVDDLEHGARVRLPVSFREVGEIEGAVGLNGQQPIRFTQFVYR